MVTSRASRRASSTLSDALEKDNSNLLTFAYVVETAGLESMLYGTDANRVDQAIKAVGKDIAPGAPGARELVIGKAAVELGRLGQGEGDKAAVVSASKSTLAEVRKSLDEYLAKNENDKWAQLAQGARAARRGASARQPRRAEDRRRRRGRARRRDDRSGGPARRRRSARRGDRALRQGDREVEGSSARRDGALARPRRGIGAGQRRDRRAVGQARQEPRTARQRVSQPRARARQCGHRGLSEIGRGAEEGRRSVAVAERGPVLGADRVDALRQRRPQGRQGCARARRVLWRGQARG